MTDCFFLFSLSVSRNTSFFLLTDALANSIVSSCLFQYLFFLSLYLSISQCLSVFSCSSTFSSTFLFLVTCTSLYLLNICASFSLATSFLSFCSTAFLSLLASFTAFLLRQRWWLLVYCSLLPLSSFW